VASFAASGVGGFWEQEVTTRGAANPYKAFRVGDDRRAGEISVAYYSISATGTEPVGPGLPSLIQATFHFSNRGFVPKSFIP